MTALATFRDTPQRYGRIVPYPVKAAVKIYQGSLCVLDAGYAKPGVTATGLFCIGRAIKTYDNTAGASGDITGEFEVGIFSWVNGDTIVRADVGKLAYVTDDQTISKDSTGKSIAGNIVDLDSGGVWVETPIELASVIGYAGTGASASVAAPVAIGDPTAGVAATFSRGDHVHPIDCAPLSFAKAGDAAANTATAETVLFVNQGKSFLISAINIYANAALTGDGTNNAVITIAQRTSGGGSSTVATLTTTANWVAWTAKSMGAITNATLAAGSQLTITVTKGGTGVQLPQHCYEIVASTDV